MSEGGPWEDAFVAVGVALGMSPDEASRALPESWRERVRPLVARLSQGDRPARARALAAALARVAVAVEEVRLS